MTFSQLIRRPSAYLPVAMSLCALAVLIGFIALYGVARQGVGPQQDEGAPARIFQLLLAAQLPIIAFFALAWLPRAPKQTLLVLLLQVSAALAALLPVVVLER